MQDERLHQSNVVPIGFGFGTLAKPKFPITLPSEAMKRLPPTYWDADKLFLRQPSGSVNMISASYSNCKSTLAACRAIAIAKGHDVKVLYIVAEGAGGFGTMTLNAAIVDWNRHHESDQITEDWLNEHLHLIEDAPQITSNDFDVLLEEQSKWKPNLVFIDTLGASAAGQQLSDTAVGTKIGNKLRNFCKRLACDLYVIHHFGKDEAKGPTGSQYFVNDPDQALELHYDGKKGLLQVYVEKAKWGVRDRTVVFGVRVVKGLWQPGWEKKEESVVVYDLAADDPRRNVTAQQSDKEKRAESVAQAIMSMGKPGDLVTQAELIARMVRKEPSENEDQFQNRRDDFRKNTLTGLVWKRGFRGSGGSPGPLFGLVDGVARENPIKPKQPYTFRVPVELE
jgi:hypothetical protein